MNPSPADTAFKYSAFVSYSHRDRYWAEWLQTALESYRLPSRVTSAASRTGPSARRLNPVFRDRSDMRSSSDLASEIGQALQAAANLIVICSPAATASRWVNDEIGMFVRLGRADKIFCLIVAGEPNASDIPGREIEECFPPALFKAYEPGPAQVRREPTAADVRPGRDGKGDAKLKLIAGILDVDFDLLKQREQRRRMQRMVVVTSAALVIMLITTGLAFEAFIERNRAVLEQRSAEQRQERAENLVQFMLGDLNDKLRQVQRLDILEAVDNRAVDYFRSLSTRDVTDQTLSERVDALLKIGRVRADQGNLSTALESYRAASLLAAELFQRAPLASDRALTFAQTLNFIGNAYWFQGDLGQARASFQHAIELLEPVADREMGNARKAELASARTNLGRVLEAQGELAAAKSLYGTVLDTYRTIAAGDPAPRWKSGLADAYDSLGKLALEQGELRQAINAYRDVRQIRAELVSMAPHDHAVEEDLLISNAILGRALSLCGADRAAENYVRQAVDAARALVSYDSMQADWQEELADYSRLLGGMTRGEGRFDEAERLDRDALRLLGDLAAKDATNATWRREMAGGQIELARLRFDVKDVEEADRLIKLALATVAQEGIANPNDRNLKLLESQAHIVSGKIAARRHDAAAARKEYAQADTVISTVADVGADPNFLGEWATALLLLHDARSQRLINQLASIGYQTPDFQQELNRTRQPYPLQTLEKRCGLPPPQVTEATNFK